MNIKDIALTNLGSVFRIEKIQLSPNGIETISGKSFSGMHINAKKSDVTLLAKYSENGFYYRPLETKRTSMGFCKAKVHSVSVENPGLVRLEIDLSTVEITE